MPSHVAATTLRMWLRDFIFGVRHCGGLRAELWFQGQQLKRWLR